MIETITKKQISIAIIFIVLAVAIGAVFTTKLKYNFIAPKSFEQCVEANGGVTTLMYPPSCNYKGQSFTDPNAAPITQSPSDSSQAKGFFEDKTLGLSFVNSSDFTVVTLPFRESSEIVFVKPAPKTNDYSPVPNPISISVDKDISNGVLAKIPGMDNPEFARMVKPQTETIGGQKAYVLEGVSAGDYPINQRIVFANGNVYRFILTDQDYLSLFKSVLDSVQFSQPIPASQSTKTSVYQNKQYGFSMEYPELWKWEEATLEQKQYNVLVSLTSPENKKLADFLREYPLYVEGPPLTNVVISRYDNLNNDYARGGSWVDAKENYRTWKELIDDPNSCEQIIGQTKIAGHTAYKITVCGLSSSFAIVFEHNGFYKIEFPSAESEQALLPEEKAILTSFKFTK